jgi:hypothetical protein
MKDFAAVRDALFCLEPQGLKPSAAPAKPSIELHLGFFHRNLPQAGFIRHSGGNIASITRSSTISQANGQEARNCGVAKQSFRHRADFIPTNFAIDASLSCNSLMPPANSAGP